MEVDNLENRHVNFRKRLIKNCWEGVTQFLPETEVHSFLAIIAKGVTPVFSTQSPEED